MNEWEMCLKNSPGYTGSVKYFLIAKALFKVQHLIFLRITARGKMSSHFIVKFAYDMVSYKGALIKETLCQVSKKNHNIFSIGDPLKIMLVEFTTNLVDSSYLGCPK